MPFREALVWFAEVHPQNAGSQSRKSIVTKDTHIMEDKEGGACVDKDEVREHCMEFVLSNEVSIRVARTTPIQI